MRLMINGYLVVIDNLIDGIRDYLSRHHSVGNGDFLKVKDLDSKKERIVKIEEKDNIKFMD